MLSFLLTPSVLSFVAVEPPAAEGQFHGGAGGGSQEASARLPLHRSAAVRQAEETDWRVRRICLFFSFSGMRYTDMHPAD